MKTALIFFFSVVSLTAGAQNVSQSILRGNQYYRQSQFDLAEAQYRKALEYDADNQEAKYNLANALQKQSKFDEATKLLEDLASTADENSMKSAAWYNQGVAYSKMKKLDESIESYKKALRLNPNDQEARENLEKALLQKKKQSSSQSKPSSGMSQKEAQQKLDMLNQKEKQLHQKKDKQNAGSGQSQDW